MQGGAGGGAGAQVAAADLLPQPLLVVGTLQHGLLLGFTQLAQLLLLHHVHLERRVILIHPRRPRCLALALLALLRILLLAPRFLLTLVLAVLIIVLVAIACGHCS